jgi:hypothetical protein
MDEETDQEEPPPSRHPSKRPDVAERIQLRKDKKMDTYDVPRLYHMVTVLKFESLESLKKILDLQIVLDEFGFGDLLGFEEEKSMLGQWIRDETIICQRASTEQLHKEILNYMKKNVKLTERLGTLEGKRL